VPAAVYRGAQLLGFLPQDSRLSEYLGLIVVGWFVVGALQAVDPRFGEKIEAFQKFVSAIYSSAKRERE